MTLIGGVLLVLTAGAIAALACALMIFGLRSVAEVRGRGAARLQPADLPVMLGAVLPWLAVSIFCGLAAWRLLEMAAALAQ
jgi:hypothetical protein